MIDLIVPVYRPDEKLEQLIEKINKQTKRPDHVLFMQTMTGTKEDERVRSILEKAENARIIPVKKEEFDHGGTRNLGASLSEAEFMLFMTQDAVPGDETVVERLWTALESDGQTAVAFGRQLPGEGAGEIECYTRQFNYPETSIVKDKGELERLGIKTYFCSNVCAMYRKSVYEELGGFVTQTIFNEDMIFAASVIQAGYRIAYVADAAVVHSHKYSYWQQLTRNFDLAVSQRQYREIFEGVKSESEGVRLVKQTAKHLLKKGKWYLLPDLVFQSGFKFIGYKLGMKYEKLPMGLVRKLSMNKNYWKERGSCGAGSHRSGDV